MNSIRFHPCGRIVFFYSRQNNYKIWNAKLQEASEYCNKINKLLENKDTVWYKLAVESWARYGAGPAQYWLGLSSVAKSRKTPKPRGSMGITSKGRLRIRDAATLLEKSVGTRNCSLYTVTLPPGFENEALEKWQEIVKSVREKIVYSLERAGITPEIIYCAEYQRPRATSNGRPVLHLHFLFEGRRGYSGKWALSVDRAARIWGRSVCGVLGRDYNPEHWKAATRIEQVKKSCSSYLGKYMSKGVAVPEQDCDSGGAKKFPPSWYGVSRTMLRRIALGIRTLTGPTAIRVISLVLEQATDLCRFGRWVSFKKSDGSDCWIAWYGDLRDAERLPILIDATISLARFNSSENG